MLPRSTYTQYSTLANGTILQKMPQTPAAYHSQEPAAKFELLGRGNFYTTSISDSHANHAV